MSQFIAGKYTQQYQYKSFSPSPINQEFVWTDKKINLLLEEATRYLGELNAYSELVPDVNFFIKMHATKEATISSRIEGTKTGIDDVVLPKEEVDPEKRDDWQEVQSYISAIDFAISELDKLPLSMRVIKNTHKILLSSVRGKHKNPGEVRNSQNWIGGSSLSDAFFIPPHQNELPNLLSDWEKFWHNKNLEIPQLIKIAIAHYQFEAIHPFSDGNGRVGRLLIPLFLYEKKVTSYPNIYLSEYLEEHRDNYYRLLREVSEKEAWLPWINFFLDAVYNQTKETFSKIGKIENLHKELSIRMPEVGSIYAERFLEAIFVKPTFTASSIKKIDSLNIKSDRTLYSLIEKFLELDIIKDLDISISRNKIYGFPQLRKIISH
jgi:Fic family protein